VEVWNVALYREIKIIIRKKRREYIKGSQIQIWGRADTDISGRKSFLMLQQAIYIASTGL
jgi:hypothetical protein